MRERDDADSHEPGAVLPGTRYLVGRRLGRGGMGTVYDTTHLETGKRYAVKVLSTRFAGREDLEARMLREAAVLGSLDSANIVRVFDVGYLATDMPFYAMERLEGQSLRDALRRHGPLAPSLACGLALQVLEALAIVHDAGLVHRDVKPENLFLRTDGTCILLDFGLVKVLLDEGQFGPQAFPTGPGELVGTCRYLPPEVLDDPCTPLAHLADLYAVGVVLVELLTGRLMLDGAPNEVYMAYLALHGFPRPYDQPPWPRVPDALRPIVEGATARQPSDRFPSARAFADELVRACERGGIPLGGVRPLLDAGGSTPPPRSEAPKVTSSATSARPRSASLGSASAIGAAGIVVGSAVSLALSSWWAGPPSAVRVAPETHWVVRAPAGSVAPAEASAGSVAPAEASAGSVVPAEAPARSVAPAEMPGRSVAPVESAPREAPPPARPPSAAASARNNRRSQLEAALRSGRGTTADAVSLIALCRTTGDARCVRFALTFLERYGGTR